MDDQRAIFIFFFLCSVSSSTVCFFTASKLNVHAPSLLLCFWWIWSATYRLEYELQRVEALTMDPFGRKYSWNNSEKDWVKKDCFGTCGHGLRGGRLQQLSEPTIQHSHLHVRQNWRCETWNLSCCSTVQLCWGFSSNCAAAAGESTTLPDCATSK